MWSVAEPACPDSAASHLISPAGFREDEKKAAQGLTLLPPTHLPLPVFRNKWELLGRIDALNSRIVNRDPGPTGFRADAGGYQSKLGFRFFPLAPLARLVQCMALFIAETMNRQSHP